MGNSVANVMSLTSSSLSSSKLRKQCTKHTSPIQVSLTPAAIKSEANPKE